MLPYFFCLCFCNSYYSHWRLLSLKHMWFRRTHWNNCFYCSSWKDILVLLPLDWPFTFNQSLGVDTIKPVLSFFMRFHARISNRSWVICKNTTWAVTLYPPTHQQVCSQRINKYAQVQTNAVMTENGILDVFWLQLEPSMFICWYFSHSWRNNICWNNTHCRPVWAIQFNKYCIAAKPHTKNRKFLLMLHLLYVSFLIFWKGQYKQICQITFKHEDELINLANFTE